MKMSRSEFRLNAKLTGGFGAQRNSRPVERLFGQLMLVSGIIPADGSFSYYVFPAALQWPW